MSEIKELNDKIHEMDVENSKLRGEILATGIILAQLLQSISRTQLNPHGFVTKIMQNAQEAVKEFKPNGDTEKAKNTKERALQIVKFYEEQLRSVLPV